MLVRANVQESFGLARLRLDNATMIPYTGLAYSLVCRKGRRTNYPPHGGGAISCSISFAMSRPRPVLSPTLRSFGMRSGMRPHNTLTSMRPPDTWGVTLTKSKRGGPWASRGHGPTPPVWGTTHTRACSPTSPNQGISGPSPPCPRGRKLVAVRMLNIVPEQNPSPPSLGGHVLNPPIGWCTVNSPLPSPCQVPPEPGISWSIRAMPTCRNSMPIPSVGGSTRPAVRDSHGTTPDSGCALSRG